MPTAFHIFHHNFIPPGAQSAKLLYKFKRLAIQAEEIGTCTADYRVEDNTPVAITATNRVEERCLHAPRRIGDIQHGHGVIRSTAIAQVGHHQAIDPRFGGVDAGLCRIRKLIAIFCPPFVAHFAFRRTAAAAQRYLIHGAV